MKVLVVNFNVPGKGLGEVAEMMEPLVPAFSNLPGMLAKIWIADEPTNTYGAVYLWRDDEALAAFVSSELWAGVRAHPALANMSEKSFDCIEAFTKETQPVLSIV